MVRGNLAEWTRKKRDWRKVKRMEESEHGGRAGKKADTQRVK
jgi:hypothetical protein